MCFWLRFFVTTLQRPAMRGRVGRSSDCGDVYLIFVLYSRFLLSHCDFSVFPLHIMQRTYSQRSDINEKPPSHERSASYDDNVSPHTLSKAGHVEHVANLDQVEDVKEIVTVANAEFAAAVSLSLIR